MIMTKSHLPAIFVVEDPNGSVQGSLHFVHNLRRDRFKFRKYEYDTTISPLKGELRYCSRLLEMNFIAAAAEFEVSDHNQHFSGIFANCVHRDI